MGLSWAEVHALNPRVVYGSISGYGEDGPWVGLPGQDLLAQSFSGVTWLNGHEGDGPVPLGLSVADMLAGHVLTEGILAALVRRGIDGQGSLIQTSLLEALIDLQFELLTTHLNDGGRLPSRSNYRNANAYLAAPYGIYPTRDGYLALAMMPLEQLGAVLPLPKLLEYSKEDAFTRRDEIKRVIAVGLLQQDTAYWLKRLQPEDIWCAEVLDWPRLLNEEGFQRLDILQTVGRDDGTMVHTTRSPLRVNGFRPQNGLAAPRVGQHSEAIRAEFRI